MPCLKIKTIPLKNQTCESLRWGYVEIKAINGFEDGMKCKGSTDTECGNPIASFSTRSAGENGKHNSIICS